MERESTRERERNIGARSILGGNKSSEDPSHIFGKLDVNIKKQCDVMSLMCIKLNGKTVTVFKFNETTLSTALALERLQSI